MASTLRRSTALFIFIAAAFLAAPAARPAPPLGGPLPAHDWERKVGPFLKRLIRGTHRVEGRFSHSVPPGSPEVMRSLPSFVRAARRADRPVVYARARIVPAAASRPASVPVESRLTDLGVEVRARVGEIVSLRVPVAAIRQIAALPELRWIKAARAYHLMNETSTGSAHVGSDAAQSAFMTSGAGVIVAIVDTGIDWRNADFRNPDDTTRILAIWDQTITDAGHPPPPGFSFGAHYTASDIDAALAPGGTELLTRDEHGHGTHVAGSAAGNGLHTGNGVPAGTFAGVAPEADLIAVRVFAGPDARFCDDCDLTAAVQFIRQTAEAAGKPWVGNMSLGDDIGGAHDGTAPDELAIDAAVGPGRPGAQMAIAAGNSGSGRAFHWQGTLVQGATSTNSFTLPVLSADGPENDFIWLDLWYEGSDQATVEIVTPDLQTVSTAWGVDSGIVCTSSGAVQIDATNAPDPANGDNQVFIQIWDEDTCGLEPEAGIWTIRVIAQTVAPSAGSFDLWNAADADALASVTLAFSSASKTVTVPGTSRNALVAGAYVDKNSWVNGDGNTTDFSVFGTVGSRSSFSGRGPTRDGRTKPDLSAPGEWLGSSRSEFIVSSANSLFGAANSTTRQERDQLHYTVRGTSMATPHVAGSAALLFAINPDLDGGEVRSALTSTARTDSFTGSVPNNLYGYGKLNGLRAAYEGASRVTDLAPAAGGGFTGTAHPEMLSYNVYRKIIPGLTATDYGSCLAPGLPSPDYNDPTTPSPGESFIYLFTGVYPDPVTATPVEGSLGNNGDGDLRPNNFPCP